MQALNNALLQGTPVGVQTSIYWLRYFPDSFRFHFNAHNLVVYGYENGESFDSVWEIGTSGLPILKNMPGNPAQ